MSDNAKEVASRVCSDIFILSVGACPTLRDAGRGDIADAIGSCVSVLTSAVAAEIEHAALTESNRMLKRMKTLLERDETTNDQRALVAALLEVM